MSSKTENIQRHIDECDLPKTQEEAKRKIRFIFSVYQAEISEIYSGLDSQKEALFGDAGGPYDYNHDLLLLKEKLINYKSSLEREESLYKQDKQTLVNIDNSNQNTKTASNSVNISLENVIESVEKISSLEDEDKDLIIGMLSSLEHLKNDKKKFWSKCQKILSWVAHKTIDVGIAVLPYIGQIKRMMGA